MKHVCVTPEMGYNEVRALMRPANRGAPMKFRKTGEVLTGVGWAAIVAILALTALGLIQ